ncbi:phosphoglucosamine mutase [Leptospira borgpetersenii]|uniref:phosphoglucosamine mutase n=1 Tax=Leptospira borgpetersenii TaxID=174 RepID=UPI00077388AB|nr:phosphoglucosamine mutase [Leptospira borgpetersenii]MBE8365111.1 phosphoglucosamine mutase [Leptospira borgpetersenii serovar Balcanica]MBE8367756.1 phosphoglucosamine mutase [Leptospira borgpetersenii serovar Balcanica]MBE8401471.1 phosphoglucosamine mutase [Leptospira borgpetersenii serovar Tarassovi]MBE8404442.1 phosphoglucosamine mutase [Leptospira borgpetersenii serovar Tarassovi]MBE8407618.1 phosphoglucosamine mutase [Leptospira borgpetersenii serovar Tarassovi]
MNTKVPVFNHPDLMVSVSGIRGIIPTGLSPEVIFNALRAFGTWIEGSKVVIGRDSRPSGPYIENIALGLMQAMGKDVLQLGIVPTPTVKAVVNLSKAGGGIMVSASHNPILWNAFKFIGPGGFFTGAADLEQILDTVRNQSYRQIQYKPSSKIVSGKEWSEKHIESVLKRVNVSAIRKKKYKVLVDAVNGAGSALIPELLGKLGCKPILLHCSPDGTFPRPPEPTPDALKQTSRKMKSSGADIGFALDPDADRLVVLTPKKGAISEEYTLPLSFLSLTLGKMPKKANLVVNLSTSFINEFVAGQYGVPVSRSKVGEANVVSEMLRQKSIFGGEGNGGVIDPAIASFGRDSLSGIAHILNGMAATGKKIDSIVEELPAVHMQKTSFKVAGKNLQDIYSKFSEEFSAFSEETLDGLRLASDDSWIHIRPSNTEPIIRVIAEARTKKDLNSLLDRSRSLMENA